MSKFPCTKCGACCRIAGRVGIMPAQKNGDCIYLKEDMTCRIYETRPVLCRLDVIQRRSKMDPDTFREVTAKACNILQEGLGVPESFRVELE